MHTTPVVLRTLLCLLVLFSSRDAAAQNCPQRASWPTKAWPVSLATGKGAAIAELEKYAFTLIGDDAARLGFRTDALLIVKSGTIIYERYARGYDASKRHVGWSIAKSVSSTLIGLAVHKGLVDLNESICTYLTRFVGSPSCAIALKDAITFGSGFQWQEEVEGVYQESSVISMLFGTGHHDQVAFQLKHRLAATPGTRFMYSSGDAHTLSTIAKTVLNRAYGADAFWTQFFDKIGASRIVLEEDSSGNTLGGSFLFATPRDYARIGYFALNDGCWDGERLLPEGWMKTATTVSETFKSNEQACNAPKSKTAFNLPCEATPAGYMWWLNQPPRPGVDRPYPSMPFDTFEAEGHWGQRIIVIPSRDVVIVRTGDDREGYLPADELIRLSLEIAQ